MTKPRLLALVQLPPPIHGVSRANQVLLNDPQLLDQFEVTVLNLSYGGTKASRGQASTGRILYGLTIITRLIRALRTTDLVYLTPALQGHALWRDAMIARLITRFNVPYVLHPHSGGIGTDDQDRPFGNRLRRAVERMFSNAQRVLLLHESIRDGYEGYLSNDQSITYVGNGVPRVEAYPFPNTNMPLRLAFIGNLIPYKGFHHAIEVVRESPQATLDVVGDFSDKNYEAQIRRQIEKHQLGDRIVFHGRQEPDEAWSSFERCHFLVFTSDWKEGLPLVWLESMIRGLPIASFKIGAWRLLEEAPTPILAEVGDCTTLVQGMHKLISHAEHYLDVRRSIAEQAHAEYASERWAQRIVRALKQAV